MAEVKLLGLHKQFGDVVALNDVSFDINHQELVTLLGPTGAGKTTTLRCVVGLEKPENGEIYLNGELINHYPPGQRNMAFVSQHYALYPHYSVFDNLAFPLKKTPMTRDEIKARVDQIANVLHIEPLLQRKPDKLSGGEMQRVVIGRAMVRNPELFLLDEPLSNLDAKLREELRFELKRLQIETGATMLYVTHDQVEAMSMSDRIVVLYKGVIQQIGTPKEIYSWPANTLVSGFVGSPGMNLLDVDIVDGTIVHDSNGQRMPVPAGYLPHAAPGKYRLGIRAEDIKVVPEGTTGAWKAEVYLYEALGHEKLVELNIGKKRVKARFSPRTRVEIGEILTISMDESKVRLFDQNGQHIRVAAGSLSEVKS